MSEQVARNPLRALVAEWPLFVIPFALSCLGILTMHPFGEATSLAPKQMVWVAFGLVVYFICAVADMRFIRRTPVIITGYAILLALLSLLLVAAHAVMGAKSWFTFAGFSLQPADPGKILFIALIAKYFSRRHMEIGDFRHIIVSGVYAAIPILLILLEPGTPKGFHFIQKAREKLIEIGAFLLAPCPHAQNCPITKNDWCHFSVRLPRSSLHRQLKGGSLSYEDEKFSYLIFSRTPISASSSRVVRHPFKGSGFIKLQLCTETGLREKTISRKDKELYSSAKKIQWGDEI